MTPKENLKDNLLAPKQQEPDAELDQLARLEGVYEEALCMEFDLRKIPFMRQERVGITYKGRAVGKGKLDLLVGGRLICRTEIG